MIPFASQRGLGQDLATHLLNAHDNEILDVAEVRGAIARDLHGAFAEWEAQAHALTQCSQYLYSLSINPDQRQGKLSRDQYFEYIARVEDKLSLSGQPRAVVFHEKYGREHCHVVWSRVDVEQEKAVQMSWDHSNLMIVTRQFAREHGLALPDGYEKTKSGKKEQLSLYELHRQRITGLSKDQHKEQVTDAFRASDSPKAFLRALEEKGYVLARGKRPFVLVDYYGGTHALPRLITDKEVNTKYLRAFFGDAYAPETLPSVEEAVQRTAEHRRVLEAHLKSERRDAAIRELKHTQAQRRHGLEKDQGILKYRQHAERLALAARHKSMRERLRGDYLAKTRWIRIERGRNKPTGLAAFLGKVSGINLIRKKLHRYQDRKRLEDYLDTRDRLKVEQEQERLAQLREHEMRRLDLQRQVKAMDAVEKREMKSLEESLKRGMRETQRGGRDDMPSLEGLMGERTKKAAEKDKSRKNQFREAASGKKRRERIDLSRDFERVASGERSEEEGGGQHSETLKPASEPKIKRTGRWRRQKNRNLDRGR